MATTNKDYVNPYGSLAQYHKDGLDYIATNWTGTETEEDLANMVYDYIITVFTDVGDAGLLFELMFKSTMINAINGYLNYGQGINPEFRSEPVQFLGTYFNRIEDTLRTSTRIKSPASNDQLTLSLGKASYEYWKYQVDNSGTSDWTAYLTGNVATDLNDIPYWVTAAMFGSRFSYNQPDSNSGEAMGLVSLSALGGSIVVSAAKILFGLVPKVNKKCNYKKPSRTVTGEKQLYHVECVTQEGEPFWEGDISADSPQEALNYARDAHPYAQWAYACGISSGSSV